MHCPDCDYQNPEEAKFCNECGCHLVETLDTAEAALQTESERKHVTIMFSDLSGYTAMNEKLDPEEIRKLLDKDRDLDKLLEKMKKDGGRSEGKPPPTVKW